MILDELLKKTHRSETLQEIEVFLTSSSRQEDIIEAKLFKASVLFTLKQQDAALSLLDEMLIELKFQNVPQVKDQIRDLRISIFIDSKRFQRAKTEIELRKEELPILKHYIYYLDLIRLKKATNEPFDDEIVLALSEQIPTDKRQEFLLLRLNALMEKKQYEEATKTIEEIRSMLVLPTIDQILIEMEMEILYHQNDLDGILSYERISEIPKQDFYILYALINKEKYRQASIYEVEHETRIDELDLESRKQVYQLLIQMYDKTGPIISLETYQKKLKKVIKQIESKEKIEKIEVDTQQEVTESIKETIKENIETEIYKQEVLTLDIESPKKNNDKIGNHETLLIASNLLKMVAEQNDQAPFRERLRLILLYIEREVAFSDAIIYLKPNIYHYKKERLYDKKFEMTDLFKTALGMSYETLDDIVESTDILKYQIDILTGKSLLEVGIKQIYSYPIGQLGAIVFYQNEIEDIMKSDDVFKLTSLIINNLHTVDKDIEKKDRNNQLFQRFFESKLVVFRILTDHQIKFNPYGRALLGFNKTDSVDKYIQKINTSDQVNYQNALRRLKKKETTKEEITYGYESYVFKEVMFLETSVYPNEVYSYIEDVTKEKAYETELFNQSIKHQKYELKNTNALYNDFPTLIEDKCSFILIGLEKLEDLEIIYGKHTIDAYYNELVCYINQFNKDIHQTYYLDDYKTLLVIKKNDIRAVEKWINSFFKSIMSYESTTLKKQTYMMNIGIIRYPINTEEKNIDKVLKYLSIALVKSKRIKEGFKYQYFDYNDFVDDQFENNLILQIDHQITNETLDICFTQIVDIVNNRIYGYDVNVYSNEIEISSQYFYIIASKRNLLEKLEKYLIRQTFKALNEIVKKTEKYVRLSLSISAHTLKLPEFTRFVFGLYEQYQIPYHLIDFVFLMKDGNSQDYQKTKELSEAGISVGVDQLPYTLEEQTNFYHLNDRPKVFTKRYLDLLKYQKQFFDEHKIGVVYYNVYDKIEEQKLKDIGIKYIKNQKSEQTLKLNEILDIIKN